MSDGQVVTHRRSLYGKYLRELKSNIVFGIVASAVLFILATMVIVNNLILVKVYVSGSSMEHTLHSGDIVVLNTCRAPRYGEIIVVSGEKSNGDWLIKRAIAFGGDTVKIQGGYVYLKKAGETEFIKLEEPYLARQGITFWDDAKADGYLIAENNIFYLGDNRQNSKDSRSEFGTCETSQVVGVVSEFAVKTRGLNKFLDKIFSPVKQFITLNQ